MNSSEVPKKINKGSNLATLCLVNEVKSQTVSHKPNQNVRTPARIVQQDCSRDGSLATKGRC